MSTRRNTSLLSLAVGLLLLLAGVQALAEAPHPAVTPTPRKDKWWRAEHQQICNRVRSFGKGARVIFIGDSITHGWQRAGRLVWRKHFGGPHGALNLGIGGDRTQHVLWRLEHGALAGLRPRVAVLLIGVNNVFDKRHQPAHIRDGVRRILDVLARRLPATRVLLLGVFPAGERPGPLRGKITELNGLLARLARAKEQVTFLDIGQSFLGAREVLPAAIAFDQLHLTAKGYGVWARAMLPTLKALMGQPARTIKLLNKREPRPALKLRTPRRAAPKRFTPRP